MTTAVDDPRSSFTFANAPGVATLPDTAQAALLIGVGSELPATCLVYGSGASVRTAYGESRLTEIAEAHFTLDPARHPIAICGTAATVPGVLTVDSSGVTGGGTVAAGTATPLNSFPKVRVTFVTGGTVGTPGIVVDASVDDDITTQRIALESLTTLTLPGKGIAFNLSGVFNAGDVIEASAVGPKWNSGSLQAAMTAAKNSAARFSLVGIAEPLDPADGTTITGFLNDLEAGIPRRYCHAIASVRRRYLPATTATIVATFANDNPDTLTRATGSFITAGFKPGMRVTISGAVNSGNNGLKVRIATVVALTLTFTSNVAFTAEVSTANVVVSAEETADDYAYNAINEWSAFSDHRVTLTIGDIRAARPYDGSQPDQPLAGYLLARCIAEPPDIEPGQRRRTPRGGGRVAADLNGRVIEGNITRVIDDAANLPALVVTPSRFAAVQSEADGRPGVFFVQSRTMFANDDQVKFLYMARLANEAKTIILSIQIDAILEGLGSDPRDPKKLSARALEALNNAGMDAMRDRFRGMISNLDAITAEEIPFRVEDDTDLSTGIIKTRIFIRTKFYPRGFSTVLFIRAPGT